MPMYFSLRHDVGGYLRDEFSLAGTLIRNMIIQLALFGYA